jgi:hypothetical protein
MGQPYVVQKKLFSVLALNMLEAGLICREKNNEIPPNLVRLSTVCSDRVRVGVVS